MGHGDAGIGVGLTGSHRSHSLLLCRDADRPLRRDAGRKPGLLLNLATDDDKAGTCRGDRTIAGQPPVIG